MKQVGSTDAVLIQHRSKNDRVLRNADNDFRAAARQVKYPLWTRSELTRRKPGRR